MLPRRVAFDPFFVDADLERGEVDQILADLDGPLCGKAIEQPDESDLVGESEAVVHAASLGDFRQVGFG